MAERAAMIQMISFIGSGLFSGIFSVAMPLVVLAGCANHPCRQMDAAKTADTAMTSGAQNMSGGEKSVSANSASSAALVGGTTSGPAPAAAKSGAKGETVKVFKYDGSRQCEPGTGVSAAVMQAKELAGIKVISSEHRSDGRMRAQACGMPTGMINVYEIDIADLPKAEKQGFKKI
jgi:hypothetical protein